MNGNEQGGGMALDRHGGPSDGAVTGERRRRRSYIARHWNGELPLWVSFWINGVLLNYAIYFASMSLHRAMEAWDHPRIFAALVVSVWVFSIAVAVWQLKGIWFSAKAKVANTGRRFWARTAQVLVLLNCVQLVFLYAGLILPNAVEFGKVALGRDSMGGASVAASPERGQLQVSGGVGFGLTQQVREQLDVHPELTVVQLESRGGRGSEASKLRELIAARGLSTRVTTHCESACTMIFMAGKNRELSKDGKLGFHAPWNAGVNLKGPMQQFILKDKQALAASGIDSAFLDKAFSIPTEDMWYPSVDELVQARVVTRVE